MSIALYIAGSGDRTVEQLLTQSGMRVTHVSGEDLADLAQPDSPQPEAIVLDVRRDSRLPASLGFLRSYHPTTPVVVVASTLDPTLMLDAMRAGVNECVAEPLNPVEMNAALRRVLSKRSTTGPVYAFIGAKGGVGSTTLAVNVASAINQQAEASRVAAQSHVSTLLVDLHLMFGDCALFLGADPRFSVVDALENSHRLDQAFLRGVVAHTPGGPDLLASCDRFTTAAPTAQQIQALIEFVSQQYPYIVLDVPRLNGAVFDALSTVSTIVLVVSQDLATLRSARAVSAVLRLRYGKDKVQFVLSRHDPQAEITKEDVNDALGEAVAFTVPSEYRAAVQAINRGRPVAFDRHGKLSPAFHLFAGHLTGLKPIPLPPVPEPPAKLFERFALRSLLP